MKTRHLYQNGHNREKKTHVNGQKKIGLIRIVYSRHNTQAYAQQSYSDKKTG